MILPLTFPTARRPSFAALAAATLLLGTPQASALQLEAGVPIHVDADEPAPVLRAVEDLKRDLGAVFGEVPEVVDGPPDSGPAIIVRTGGGGDALPAMSGREQHRLYEKDGRVILNGADMRGTIYAVYSFSELFLGIRPLWFWASETPERRISVEIPEGFHKDFDPPDVKYRAWFPNDRDLVIPWQRRSEKNRRAFYEAMLRLKLNTLEGGIADDRSFEPPYPAGREASLARDHGLMVTGHHMLVFGSSYNDWERYWENTGSGEVPELSLDDRASLREFWKFHIELARRNGLDPIWLVGFRGNRDIPFWEFFPDSPETDGERARVIEEMIAMQIGLLKEVTGEEHPLMRLTLYNEMSRLVANGDFRIPDERSLIHNFVAARRDHFPGRDLLEYPFDGEKTGYYMNLQFNSSGSHLAQAEGPWKIERNFRTVDRVSGGNLVFSVMNAGNVREHLMGLSANAAMMWDLEDFDADAFLRDFCAAYFGTELRREIADLYRDYFESYWRQRDGDLEGFERQYIFHDLRYARAAEMLLGDMENGAYRPNLLRTHRLNDPDKGSPGYFRVEPRDNGTANQIEAMVKGTSESIRKLEAVVAETDRIRPRLRKGRSFFDDNLRGQAYFMLRINRMLRSLTRAYMERSDPAARAELLRRSLGHLDAAQEWLDRASQGRFEDWYGPERIFGLDRIRERIAGLEERGDGR